MTNTRRFLLLGALIGFLLSLAVQVWLYSSLYSGLYGDDQDVFGISDWLSLLTGTGAVTQVLFDTALGAVVGAVLALVRSSAGRIWMAGGAVVGVVVALLPALVAMWRFGATSQSLSGNLGGYFAPLADPVLSTAAIAAAAAGLWLLSRGASPAEATLEADAPSSDA